LEPGCYNQAHQYKNKENNMADSKGVASDKLSSEVGGLAIDPEKKSASEADVLKAWSGFVNSTTELKLESFENVEGSKTWRLFNNNDNSTVAEAHGEDGLLKLYRGAGLAIVEPGKAKADAADPHPMPGTGVAPNKNQVHVSDAAAQENPGTAVAKARKKAGQPIAGGGGQVG
jgi:hypothetical protein